MTEDNSQQTKPKFSRKRIITYSILGTLLIIIALAFGLPFLATDGTENFSGKEQQVAKQAIGDGSYEAANTNPIPDLAIGFRGKVVSVSKHPTGKRCGSHGQGSTYMVDIRKVTFFGIIAPGHDDWICSFDE